MVEHPAAERDDPGRAPQSGSPLKPERIQREPPASGPRAREAHLLLAELEYWRITAAGRGLAARFRRTAPWGASALAAVAVHAAVPEGLAVRIELVEADVRLSLSGWVGREPSLPAVRLAAALETLAAKLSAEEWGEDHGG